MRAVLTEPWGRGRRTNLQDRSRLAAICLAQQLPETNSCSVAEKGDRSDMRQAHTKIVRLALARA
jgi:hypothetical protein